jgi:2-dehydro-3-deoxyphosphooctonate aldolase (KDO 8-P synthase)
MDAMVSVRGIPIGHGAPLALIAGPCVIETPEVTRFIAERLKQMTERLGMPLIFKASFDKANRTAIGSYRGPGIEAGLGILSAIKEELDLPVLSDVHQAADAERAAEVLDVLQIPAFLCRQTDLILAAAATGKPVNIKKGQFLAPWDMGNIIDKAVSTGNTQLLITERGSMFGYNNLVVDFRSIDIMQGTGYPVVFDATHSVQLPGGSGTSSGGQRQFAPLLACAAVAAGADAVFMEVHPDPDNALCDGPNSLFLEDLPDLLGRLQAIRAACRKGTTP